MSQFVTGNRRTFIAASDLSAKQFYILKATSTANNVDLASAATDFLVGTLRNLPKSGDSADVMLRSGGGTALVILGGVVNVGDKLTSDSNGKAVATTSGGDEIIGRALFAGVANDIIEYAPCFDRV